MFLDIEMITWIFGDLQRYRSWSVVSHSEACNGVCVCDDNRYCISFKQEKNDLIIVRVQISQTCPPADSTSTYSK